MEAKKCAAVRCRVVLSFVEEPQLKSEEVHSLGEAALGKGKMALDFKFYIGSHFAIVSGFSDRQSLSSNTANLDLTKCAFHDHD